MAHSKESSDKNVVRGWKLIIKDPREYSPPFINPIIRFMIYSYIVLLTGNVFMGWTGFQEILYKAGAFEDLCDITNSEFTIIGPNRIIDCPARKASMNDLYTIAFSVNFTFSFVSGTILDLFGHKITFLFGHLVNFFCWILMGLFPKKGWLLRLIMVIIGLTAETLYLPLTTVSLYFPANKSLILSIIGSIRTVSFFMPTILSYIYIPLRAKKEHFYIVAITFGAVAYFGSFLIGLFIVPWNFFNSKHKHVNIDTQITDRNKSTHEDGQIHKCSINHRFKSFLTDMKLLLKSPNIVEAVFFTIAASLYISAVEFINKAQRELLVSLSQQSVLDVFRYVQILTFFPGLFIGYFADRFGSSKTMFIQQISLLLTYIMIATNKYHFMMAGCIMYIVGGSMYLSIVYFYIYENFPPERVGILLGIILVFSGIGILCNIPLYKHGLKIYKPGNFTNISWILSVYLLISIASNIISLYIKLNNENMRSKNDQTVNVL